MIETTTLAEIKKELQHLPQKELLEVCLKLVKYKKANKELAHYLLFEAHQEDQYIEKAKEEIRLRFEEMPTNSLYFTTKYLRKTLRLTQKFAQYSKVTQTEIELLIEFCQQLKYCHAYWKNYQVIEGIYRRQIEKIRKEIKKLHEDLQYDYEKSLDDLAKLFHKM